MSRWERVTLKELLTVDKKVVSPKDIPDDYPYIGLEDISKGTGKVRMRKNSSLGIESSKYLFIKDHILYGKLRPNLNKVAIPNYEGVCSTDIFPILVTNGRALREYVYYVLRGKSFVSYASNRANGANLPRINEKIMYDYQISIPPPSIQEKIVSTLSTVETLGSIQHQHLVELDSYAMSVFFDLFGASNGNYGECEETSLSNYLNETPKNGLYKHQSLYGEGTKIVRIDSFDNGYEVNIDHLKKVRLTSSEIEQYKLKKNDILVNRVNSIDLLGKIGVIPEIDEDVVFESNMMRFRLNQNYLLPSYLMYLWRTKYIKRQIMSKAKNSVNQSSINQNDVLTMKIPIPPIELQNQFADIVAKIEEQKALVKQAIDETQQLFDSLMSQYFD